jgi:hypothetical protein
LANLQDVVAWNKGVDIDVHAYDEVYGHIWITSPDDPSINISVYTDVDAYPELHGFRGGMQYLKEKAPGCNTRNYTQDNPKRAFHTVRLHNVNRQILTKLTNNLDNGIAIGGGKLYYGLGYGCINGASQALLFAGVPTITAFLPTNSPMIYLGMLKVRGDMIIASPYIINTQK